MTNSNLNGLYSLEVHYMSSSIYNKKASVFELIEFNCETSLQSMISIYYLFEESHLVSSFELPLILFLFIAKKTRDAIAL